MTKAELLNFIDYCKDMKVKSFVIDLTKELYLYLESFDNSIVVDIIDIDLDLEKNEIIEVQIFL